MAELEHISAPQFIMRDRNGRALAMAIDAAMAKFKQIVQKGLADINDTDNMDEWRLDELAWEYALPWYDYSADIESKRRVIKSIYETISIMGTPRAVANVISASLGSVARLAEWFEYNGEPYHFRVISSGEILSATELAKLYSAIDAAKNVRSVMDNLLWAWAAQGDLYIMPAAQMSLTIAATGEVIET